MPDTDGINGPFADRRTHCAHCDEWITGPEAELQHRTECGPKFRAGVERVTRLTRPGTYEEGVAYLQRKQEVEDGRFDVPAL